MSLFPSYFNIQNMNVTSNVPTVSSESQGLITHVRRRLAQRWDIDLDCIVTTIDKSTGENNTKKAMAWKVGLQGGTIPNEFVLPVFGQSNAADTTTLNAITTGTTSIDLNNVTDVQEGDYFTFAGHTKVYMVMAISVNTVTFFPNLVSGVALGEAVTFNPEFTVICANVASFRSASARQPQSFTFNFVEAL
jgi:hypothetical protein